MTKIFNDPSDFAAETSAGFVRAFPTLVEQVPGGVRTAAPTPGKVAVVIGGGSGHYPAFAGWVGPGLADGAVVGDVFASPSAHQVVSVAMAAQAGAGLLLIYGNYAGDVLNFKAAPREELIASGVSTRSIVITDDLASGRLGPSRCCGGEPRGIYLSSKWRLRRPKPAMTSTRWRCWRPGRTSGRPRSVWPSPDALPGFDGPLFSLPAGRMGVGLGLHGEPGISEEPLLRTAELADLLVARRWRR
jgi:dihydroxyacetone kinase